jgi:hypothetical protein
MITGEINNISVVKWYSGTAGFFLPTRHRNTTREQQHSHHQHSSTFYRNRFKETKAC